MAPKKGGGGGKRKGSKGKASLSKISNKRLNKLAKQGKLKKHLNASTGSNKSKYIRLLEERTRKEKLEPEELEALREREKEEEKTDIPLEEADYEYFSTANRDFSFLLGLGDETEEKKKRKRKRKPDAGDDDALETRYESSGQRAAAVGKKQVKSLLPIKSDKGVIARTEEVLEEDEEDEEKEETASAMEEEESTEPLPDLSMAEIFVVRQSKLAERKQRIALLASAIIENPEEHYGKLKELRLMLEEAEADVQVTVKKLAMITLLEVFKDIIPGYHIRLTTEKEKQQAVKLDTKKLRQFEESLLNNYRNYLEFLEAIIKGKPPKSKNKKVRNVNGVQIPEEAAKGMREVALRCMCELLLTHPHFNFRTNIIAIIAPYTDHNNKKLSAMVCGYVKNIFREDRTGEVTLELVRLIGRIIKAKHFSTHPQVLALFLALKIKEVQKDEDKEDNKEARREKYRNLSRKEKKRHKQMNHLEKELEDAAVLNTKNHRLKHHTEIISVVFLSYFRILKQQQHSPLIAPVLQGLAKFAHLINVDFFVDLFAVLNNLVDSGELSYQESLHCVQTAFTILSGQGAVLNVDPMRFYNHLYNLLFSIHAGVSSVDVPLVLECVDIMITKRRKQVSYQRLIGFTKRLMTLTLQLWSHGSLGVMAAIRNLLQLHARSDILLDTESQGSGMYLPELTDPEHCNANNTALWELHLLQKHYHPAVRKYACHVAAGCPSQGVGQLPADLARRGPVELYQEFDPSELKLKPPMQKTLTGKKKRSAFTNFNGERIIMVPMDIDDIVTGMEFHKHFSKTSSTKKKKTLKKTSSDVAVIEKGDAAVVNGKGKSRVVENGQKKCKVKKQKAAKKGVLAEKRGTLMGKKSKLKATKKTKNKSVV